MCCYSGKFCRLIRVNTGICVTIVQSVGFTGYLFVVLTFRMPVISVCLHQSPIDKRIIDECLQDGHKRFLVVAQDFHGDLACISEATFDSADLEDKFIC